MSGLPTLFRDAWWEIKPTVLKLFPQDKEFLSGISGRDLRIYLNKKTGADVQGGSRITLENTFDIWSPIIFSIIPWGGGECPVPADTKVCVYMRGGAVSRHGTAFTWSWEHYYKGDTSDIIAYRILT